MLMQFSFKGCLNLPNHLSLSKNMFMLKTIYDISLENIHLGQLMLCTFESFLPTSG